MVQDGLVEISGLVDQKVRLVFSQVGPGDIFGEMAVIENKPRSACAVAKAGTKVYFIPRAEMLALVERSPALALALLREISHRLREFNRQYLREVLQAERLAIVGRFARSIVHDLKNPLNIIGLTAEMASMDRATPEMRQQAAARIRKQVERISDLISEILDFTQGSQSDFVLAPADYGAFVKQLVEELGPGSGAEGCDARAGEPAALGGGVASTRNACAASFTTSSTMPPMRCRREARSSCAFRPPKAKWSPRSRTAGRGIAPEIAGQLFEVFATHGKAHGTGLGLSICKRIIEDHQGWISARNQPGRGAVFSFGLPRRGRAGKG